MQASTGHIGPQTIQSIDFLRAIACLMVVYCHVIGRPLIVLRDTWLPATLVNDFILQPLNIIQRFGFLGVAVFFLISGFIITHTGLNESRFTFAIKRVFRIYPALTASVAVVLLLIPVTEYFGIIDKGIGHGYSNAFLAMLGMDAGFTKQPLMSVSWTLSLELFFYALIFGILPVLKTRPVVAMLSILAFSVILTSTIGMPYHPGRMAAHFAAFMPPFVIGMAIYFCWSGRVGLRHTALILFILWVVMIIGFTNTKPVFMKPTNSYPTQIFYATAIFLGALWVYGRREVAQGAVILFFSKISYSLYLLHLPISSAITLSLHGKVGYAASISISLAVSIFVSYAMYRFIERPGQVAGRRIIGLAAEMTPSLFRR